MIRILLAEDHALVREGLKLLLSVPQTCEVVGETGDGALVEAMVRELRPDLVLLDMGLPGKHGVLIAADIKAEHPQVRVLAVTADAQLATVRGCLLAGADGYLLKSEDADELRLAIRTVLDGRQFLSPAIAARLDDVVRAEAVDPVTPREEEIMGMIARGLRNEDIARTLSRSVFTVRKHRQNLMEKLRLRNAAEITAYAMKRNLV
jgi:DNA-binding NarL/FixJ family response regulator